MRTLIYHIIRPDDQVKAYVHTAIKYFKADFVVSCTYLSSEIARIFPEKDPRYRRYRTSGKDTSKSLGSNRRVAAAASGGHQHKKAIKDNRFDISNTLRYYSPD